MDLDINFLSSCMFSPFNDLEAGCVPIDLDLVFWGSFVSQLTDELSKVEEKLKLTESLLESKVLPETSFNSSIIFYLFIFTMLYMYIKLKLFAESRNQENQ